MAPTSDELHQLIADLQARVKQLEQRLLDPSGSSKKSAADGQSIRMVLMGPPGAGTCIFFAFMSLCLLFVPSRSAADLFM
jgi:hypothetical protein